ncbi:GH32 C-terminal domain-containing protein [Bifidobacterium pullorum subsp. saeculare]|uniref:beta-fructofuranosidase n=1 Tax=Bifidobacterium pullorum subsp. saeculare TaxID=78257 RepID=A0A938WX12_9BIFI|nr:GH32 C-terminal domain-containing protein [Bifidobacterium pullorum]MBM6699163.1 GH32 C-terminal domain-containing protein [Bifidobacterium pullorum subsp. saeculare]
MSDLIPAPHSIPNIDTPVLDPIRDHAQELAKAEAGVAALAATRDDRWYPAFHIASDGGWINDPNGLCFFGGRWHVFYQLHPYGTQWGPMHWGHVSSEDMVTWRREPIMFAPSLEQEKDGVFSGSAVVGDDGRLRFYYTGHRWNNGVDDADGQWQVQMLAEPDDDTLTSATKRGMVVDCPRQAVDSHFRDPKVFKAGGVWWMVFGVCSAARRGQMWLYRSDDMVTWRFERVLFEHPDPDVWMLECPDFFPLRGADGRERWVIGFSAMGARPRGFANRNKDNAGYLIGSWEPGGEFVPEEAYRPWDAGHNFYAPQSFTAPDGRQLMLGWMSPFDEPAPMQADGWCGNLTLVREVKLDDAGFLVTPPAAEMTGLRLGTTDMGALSLGYDEERTLAADAGPMEIEMTLDLAACAADRASLRVHGTDDGSFLAVCYDAQIGAVTVDRAAAPAGAPHGCRVAPLDPDELACGTLDLRVFVDRGCVEVYVDGGRHVLSDYSYPGAGPRAIRLVAEGGPLEVRALATHRLRSIGLE